MGGTGIVRGTPLGRILLIGGIVLLVAGGGAAGACKLALDCHLARPAPGGELERRRQPTEGDAKLPAGLSEETVVKGLTFPTSFAFLPDGRVLVAERDGVLRLSTPGGATEPTSALDLRGRVATAVLQRTRSPSRSTRSSRRTASCTSSTPLLLGRRRSTRRTPPSSASRGSSCTETSSTPRRNGSWWARSTRRQARARICHRQPTAFRPTWTTSAAISSSLTTARSSSRPATGEVTTGKSRRPRSGAERRRARRQDPEDHTGWEGPPVESVLPRRRVGEPSEGVGRRAAEPVSHDAHPWGRASRRRRGRVACVRRDLARTSGCEPRVAVLRGNGARADVQGRGGVCGDVPDARAEHDGAGPRLRARRDVSRSPGASSTPETSTLIRIGASTSERRLGAQYDQRCPDRPER